MPYFTVGIGFGANILHGGGDLQSFYQILALKIDMTRDTFLHIGYNLKDFHEPNYLMLVIGLIINVPVCIINPDEYATSHFDYSEKVF